MTRITASAPIIPVVRPRPEPGEALAGYLARVAAENGFENGRTLWSALFKCMVGCQQEPLTSLLDALNLSAQERSLLGGPSPRYCRSPSTHTFGLGRAMFNLDYRRWCPLCTATTEFIRTEWTLKFFCACPEHGCWLVSTCPECGQRFHMDSIQFRRCQCGARMDSSGIDLAPSAVIKLMAALRGAMYQEAYPGLPNLSLQDWCRLLLYLGQFTPDQQPKRPGQIANLADLSIAQSVAMNIRQLLDDWPVNFIPLLSSIQAQQGQSTSLRNSFGVLHRVLYQDLAGTGFDFIRVAFEEYVNLNWWGLVCRRHKGFNPQTVAAHPRLALKDAAKICDTSLAVINHLIDAGKIQVDEYVSASGRRTRSIHQSDLPELKILAAGFLCMADACTFLGIPERRVHELILAGKITPLASPGETRSARWYLPKSALQSLMFSGSASTPADAIAISSVLRGGRLDDGEFIAIVNGLQNGELSVVGVVPCPIGRVAVSKKVLDEFRLRWAIQHHRSLSIDQAADLLELKQQVTYQLARLGLLRTDEDPDGRLAVSMAQIQRFQRKYTSLQSIAKRMNTSPRAALARISATPVAGPSMHNCRQYFFRRSDVAELLEDQ